MQFNDDRSLSYNLGDPGTPITLPPVTPTPHSPTDDAALRGVRSGWPDVVGMLLSSLCAVHCLVTLLFLSTLTTLGAVGLADPRVERLMLASALVVGTVVLGHGALVHRRWRPLVPFVAGVLLLFLVRPRIEEGSPMELLIVLAGAAGIVGAHALSYRCRHRCLPSEVLGFRQ